MCGSAGHVQELWVMLFYLSCENVKAFFQAYGGFPHHVPWAPTGGTQPNWWGWIRAVDIRSGLGKKCESPAIASYSTLDKWVRCCLGTSETFGVDLKVMMFVTTYDSSWQHILPLPFWLIVCEFGEELHSMFPGLLPVCLWEGGSAFRAGTLGPTGPGIVGYMDGVQGAAVLSVVYTNGVLVLLAMSKWSWY